ncbi:MAG: GDSL-type esterase/lipase family protein [Prevotella sp.]|jgi:lysophospholipase L1-like esterase|nr:GDSL-type esterase/lipase family protein [Prevotella sp.]
MNPMQMKTILLACLLLFSFRAASQEIVENILENPAYLERMACFEKDPLQEGQIVFLGNSLTQGGKWDEYFPVQKPVNRGISGDNTLGMLGRLHRIIEAKPRKLFILAGINDISLGRSNDRIMTGIKSMLYQVKAGSPGTEIYVQSLLPVNNDAGMYKRLKGKEKQIEKLNRKIRKFCKSENITFIDLYPSFTTSKRKLDAKYTDDGLHLNDAGYAVWVEKIRTCME